MAEVRAFRGVRYDPSRAGDLARLVCAPYDVITPAAQAAAYARSEHNAVRLELGRDEPGDDPGEGRYRRAAAHLDAWLRAGVLRRDDAPSLYVYEEGFELDGRPAARRSFFALVRLAEWEERVVLPHERTMPRPKADRLSLLRAGRANFSPILALYEDPAGRVAAALAAASRATPLADFELEPGAVAAAAARHRLWPLADAAAVAAVQRELAGRPLYVADGHHRYETALEHWREVRRAGAAADHPAAFALLLLADPGLVVLPTHRLVRRPGLDRAALTAALAGLFAVEAAGDAARPADLARLLAELAQRGASAPAFGVAGLTPGRLHLLVARPEADLPALLPPERSAAWRRLDVAALHRVVFERLLGLSGEAAGAGEIGYTRDAAEAVGAVTAGQCELAFLLNPPRVSQVRDVALAGDRMPEKSTYFWPKPPTGVVFYVH